MKIVKEYDIKSLIEQIKDKVEDARKHQTSVVKLNNITVVEILDVLQETLKREQRHQTLESALTFVEKEDGTQTNVMEEHNKRSRLEGKEKIEDLIEEEWEDE